jgi:3-hydroxymyristoyl/3-hydroxydecanoyl-(acyl carrier protein) dehydratase
MYGEFDRSIRDGARRPLWRDTPTARPVDHGHADIAAMIPHRPPFLLVDRVVAVDVAESQIRGERLIHADDPVFPGHFPGQPVYPGVLLVEAIGQLGLCLLHLTDGRACGTMRATRIHHAVFLREVLPGQRIEIVAKRIRSDDFTAVCGGQILTDGVICAFAIMEVYFGED